MWRLATATPTLRATACSLSNAISSLSSALRSDAELVGVPRQPELARRRHVANQRRRGDDDRAGEVAFAAEPHAVLPVAIERRDRALPFFERIRSLAEALPSPGLPDLPSDRAKHIGD